MADLIHLLPDNIANQIAAGEVIQRPASAVKELLENAVDAGADEIRLLVNDAGKSLVQVVDNGRGMSATDARMCFERHATSKISGIDDLFRIRTMGFRGEALASIAAVSQVEMRTRRKEDELGSRIEIENGRVLVQEPCACAAGTSIAMRNLFFSVPARRNFLKSNAAEMKQVVDEFIRVAMAFPEILFTLSANGTETFHLSKGSLKQRVVQVMGNSYASRIVQVTETTDYLRIKGFIGKPDTAKRTRGDQYLFVNNRFIRSAYLHHAITGAFQDMLPEQSHPLYVLFLEMDPAQLDINVHPTKQEIKFEDEKVVYAFVQAAVKHALAQYSVTPALDFTLEPSIQRLDAVSRPMDEAAQSAAASGNLFQTFARRHEAHKVEPSGNIKGWRDFYAPEPATATPKRMFPPATASTVGDSVPTAAALPWSKDDTPPQQLLGSYILLKAEDGIVLVHQQLAHERVLFERYAAADASRPVAVQRSLFPVSVTMHPSDAVVLRELLPDLSTLGYLIEPFGKDGFLVQGTPADMPSGAEGEDMERLLESYKHSNPSPTAGIRERLVRALAARHCIKTGRSLTVEEMRGIVSALSGCRQPNLSVGGLPTYVLLTRGQLDSLFFR